MDATAADVAAAAAAADADTTLEFDPVQLRNLYNHASPYIVGAPNSPGYIVGAEPEHDVIAVHSALIRRIPQSVTYYSSHVNAVVDAVAQLPNDVTILFARRDGEPLPSISFANLDQELDDQERDVPQKVVNLFPCMDSLAIFKGHVVLKHAVSRAIGEASAGDYEDSSIGTFCFTCPYASSSYIDDKKDIQELAVTAEMTLGAPVFNLNGSIVCTLSRLGNDYSIKFARYAASLREGMDGLWGQHVIWLKGEDIVRPLHED